MNEQTLAVKAEKDAQDREIQQTRELLDLQTERIQASVDLFRSLSAIKTDVAGDKEMLTKLLDTLRAARKNMWMEMSVYSDLTDELDRLVDFID